MKNFKIKLIQMIAIFTFFHIALLIIEMAGFYVNVGAFMIAFMAGGLSFGFHGWIEDRIS